MADSVYPNSRYTNPQLHVIAGQSLRLVVYNIRYATGTGPGFHLPVPGAGYLRSNRRVLA
jgi:hypothetical protein